MHFHKHDIGKGGALCSVQLNQDTWTSIPVTLHWLHCIFIQVLTYIHKYLVRDWMTEDFLHFLYINIGINTRGWSSQPLLSSPFQSYDSRNTLYAWVSWSGLDMLYRQVGGYRPPYLWKCWLELSWIWA
jgi:hypothetical protein